VVQEVVIDGPEITYEAGLSGSNIGKIQANVEAFAGSMTTGGSGATQPTAPASPQKKVQINKFVLRNGRVSVSAKLLGGKALTLPLPPIELTDIGTGPEGATVGEVMKKVLGAVGDGVKDAVKKGGEVIGKGAEKLGDAAKDAGENVKEGGKKALDKIKGTFQKD
jgi:hypothetical protein